MSNWRIRFYLDGPFAFDGRRWRWIWRFWFRKAPSYHRDWEPQDWTDYLWRLGPVAIRVSFPQRKP